MFLPKEVKFFDLFDKQAENIVSAAEFYCCEHALKGGAIHIPAGISAVRIDFKQCPALGIAIRAYALYLLFDTVVFQLIFG